MSALERLLDPRPIVRGGLAALTAGIAGLALWGALAPVSGAIIAPGHVKVDLNRKPVQHQEGGTVRAVRVRDGDRVRAGDELVVLEDVRIEAQLDLLRTQLDAERARAARLEAERTFGVLRFPPELAGRAAEPRIGAQLAREEALFRARREALDSQVAALRRQSAETVREVAALREQLAAEAQAIKLQKDELGANLRLLEQGYVQRTRVLALQRAVAEYEARHGEHRAELARARQRAAELELRILGLRNAYVQGATDELKDATARAFELEERLRPSSDAAARQRIVAPIDGEVVGARVFGPGAVVGPREVLMEIVPHGERLVVEARIRPEDIDHVRPGSPADVRLTAFKPRTTPLASGTVRYVSADRLVEPQSGSAYYLAHIDVPAAALAQAGLRLQAGMPAEIFIRTDARSPFDYLAAPITDFLRRALREPL